MSWLSFALILLGFFATHAIPAIPGLRERLVRWLGVSGYGAVFGGLSTVMLVWVILAAGQAPYVGLWDQYSWMRWAANLIMPMAIMLVVLAIGVPNPLSFGGRAAGFDPVRPGVAGLMRHPLLWALFLWSSVHLLVNGDLAHAILFGSFAAFCLIGMTALDRRRQKQLGAEEWQRLARNTSNLPRPWRIAQAVTLPRLVLTIVVWVALLAAHPHVLGVSPLP